MEAYGCDATALQSIEELHALFSDLMNQVPLEAVAEPYFHKFPGEGGVTGLAVLSESHLACHTFPEFHSLCLNLFCCKPRPEWDFQRGLRDRFGAARVVVRRVERAYSAEAEATA